MYLEPKNNLNTLLALHIVLTILFGQFWCCFGFIVPLYILVLKAWLIHGDCWTMRCQRVRLRHCLCCLCNISCKGQAQITPNIKWNNIPHICHGHSDVCMCLCVSVYLYMWICWINVCACA